MSLEAFLFHDAVLGNNCGGYTASYPGLFALSEDQRRLGTERDRQIFPTSLTGDVSRDVASEIAEDDWERGWWIQ